VRQLEDELGVPIFIRQGKRLTTLTAGGEAIVASARRALQEVNNLRRIGAEFKSEDEGTLAIATTHLQARYVLPPVIKRFTERYPKVRVLLHQGDPKQVGSKPRAVKRISALQRSHSPIFPNWSRCRAIRGTGVSWCPKDIHCPKSSR
jgi:LysR family cys regulon transcriptional activator